MKNSVEKIAICALLALNTLETYAMYSRLPASWRRVGTRIPVVRRGYSTPQPGVVAPEVMEVIPTPEVATVEEKPSWWQRFLYGSKATPVVEETQPHVVRPYGPEMPTTQEQQAAERRERTKELTNLKERKAELSERLAYMERMEPDEGLVRRTKLELENIEAKTSRKAPSSKEVLHLEDLKKSLMQGIEYSKGQESYLKRMISWRPDELERIVKERQDDELKLDTINTQLKKYENLQKRREFRKRAMMNE